MGIYDEQLSLHTGRDNNITDHFAPDPHFSDLYRDYNRNDSAENYNELN